LNDLPALEVIAAETNWLVFGRLLRAAMRAHEDYGFVSPGDVISRVAELSGRDPSSLRNPLAAEAWMRRHAPEIKPEQTGETVRLAMTNVLLLAQIHAVSPDMAKELAPRVYAGTINRKELKKALEEAKQAEHAPGGVGHERWHRTRSFEERALTYLKENLGVLGFSAEATIALRAEPRTVPYDFEVRVGDEVVAVAEVKAYRQKVTHRVQVETLAVAALLRREFPEVFVVASQDWERAMPSMARIRDELRLEGVRLATLQEDASHRDHANALEFW
jgi:hypothetical protein